METNLEEKLMKRMKMKQRTKKTWVACLAALWLILPAAMQAQVHIGGNTDAVKGALLDLTTPEGSNLGLLPLNVSIDNINEIPEAFTNKASITIGDLQGLIVYNTNGDFADGAGLYVWDGGAWHFVNAAVPATSVSVSPTTKAFTSKTTQQLTATILPTTAVKTVTWESNNMAVATVGADGVVTAVGNGSATITVTTASGKTATCAVTVSIAGSSDAKIGSNTYATYCYGGNIGCWMVTNSKEGTANYTNGNNKYYSWSQRNNACVSPWAAPTEAQWKALLSFINGSSATAAQKAMWTSGGALAGFYRLGTYYNTGLAGYWWSGPTAWQYVEVANGTMHDPIANLTSYDFTVRCILNLPAL
jgi:hypothetical protein